MSISLCFNLSIVIRLAHQIEKIIWQLEVNQVL